MSRPYLDFLAKKRLLRHALTTFIILFSWLSSVKSVQAISLECAAPFAKNQYHKLLGSVEKSYRSVEGLSGEFVQQDHLSFGDIEGINSEKMSKGEIFYKKPGMMDWRYHSPNEQRFITDGHTFWYYQPDYLGGEVTITDFESSFRSDTPVSFLLGIGKLSGDFILRSACKTADGILLDLIPTKKDASLETFGLLVRERDHVPIGARTVQVGGNETIITFPKLNLRNDLTEKQFYFEIPDDVFKNDQRVNQAADGRIAPIGKIRETPLIDEARTDEAVGKNQPSKK